MKVVTIGAGSSYTPELCEGLLKRYDKLNIKEWWLVDVEEGEEKLNIIFDLVNRMVKKSGYPMKVFKTLDRREAVKNADYITTQLRVGLLDARVKDEYIPLKHGMIGQETNGAGGLFKALRTIPVVLDIVKDVQELAKPNAWIINFTNPAGLVAEAVNRLTNFKRFIGVCNVPIHTKMDVSKLLKAKESDVTYDCCGLNHLSYFTHFYLKGKEVTDVVLKEVKNPEISKTMSMKNLSNIPWSPMFIDQLNALPCPYMRYYYKTNQILNEYMHLAEDKKVRASVVKEVEAKLFEKYKDPNLDVKPAELENRGGAYYSDVACGVLMSLHTGNGDEHTVNVKNEGKISNLPSDWTVEATTTITSNGPSKLKRELAIPEAGLGLIYTIKEYELIVVEAVKEKSIEKAFLALAINPLSTDDITAEKVFKELVIAHKDYLTYYSDLAKFIK